MRDWINCISHNREGRDSVDNHRSNFQRDYDRLIFSSAFRRLQNKTQVFPLPGNTFVHNRLTHSLEVASVGRSLGGIVGEQIALLESVSKDDTASLFYKYDLAYVVAAACLAHDIGNPPFGHSGEKAISSYFKENAVKEIDGKSVRHFFDDHEWSDITNFEGNANAFHILTYNYSGKLEHGHQLTLTTLASILKYPCSSTEIDKAVKHKKKYGYFKADKSKFENVIKHTNMLQDGEMSRHPFVYLVEAADDICYRIIDFEDAHRIGIVSTNTVVDLLRETIKDLSSKPTQDIKRIDTRLKSVTDQNEVVSYLRAKAISTLINKAAQEFLDHKDEIIKGLWNGTLLDNIEDQSKGLAEINKLSIEKIYNHPSVINVEIAGYKVISELLDTYITAVLTDNPSALQKKILQIIPAQFHRNKHTSHYEKVLNILDYVAGMTDGYATEIYRNFKGIEIAKHN
jgi:dGTPase